MARMWTQFVLAFIWSLFWSSSADLCRNIRYKVPLDNKILDDPSHVVAERSVNTMDQCEIECYLHPDCVSLNYNTHHGAKPNCQLSSSDDKTSSGKLTSKAGFTYQAMQNNCAGKGCPAANMTCQSGYGSHGYRCVCPKCSQGNQCNQFKDDTVIVFPERSTKQVIVVERPFRANLKSFTLSIWAQINPEIRTHALFSYSLPKKRHSNEILIEIFVKERKQILFAVKEQLKYYHSDKFANIGDAKWHHFAFTWKGSSGEAQVYLDGVVVHPSSSVAVGKVIEHQGALVLGQDQDSYLGGYSKDQCFQGNLTSVNMWDRILPSHEITKLAQRCPSGEGNVVKWKDIVQRNIDLPYFCGISCHD